MAFIRTFIDGNTNFGGYLSVDGGKSVAIKDDMTYELENGKHHFEVHSTSDFSRKSGKFSDTLDSMTSSSGVIVDSIIKAQNKSNIGSTWEFDVILDDDDCLMLHVNSKGQKLIGDPLYQIEQLSEEVVMELRKQFEELRNTPRRSKKLIGWGLGLMICFSLGCINGASSLIAEGNIAALIVCIAMIPIGLLLFLSGMKKKVRK